MILSTGDFSVVYPDGCAEIDGSLRIDELRKRINVCFIFDVSILKDINAALRDMLRQTGIRDDSMEESENQHSVTQTQNPIQLFGLLMHLSSHQFTHHPDIDIRLRVCVAVCTMLKLFCPTNPFETLPYSQDRIRVLHLSFLIDI